MPPQFTDSVSQKLEMVMQMASEKKCTEVSENHLLLAYLNDPESYFSTFLSSLRLSDGTLFDIAPDDQPTAHGWLGGPEVKVSHFPEQEYPYHIVNTISGSFVKAKKAEAPTSSPLP